MNSINKSFKILVAILAIHCTKFKVPGDGQRHGSITDEKQFGLFLLGECVVIDIRFLNEGDVNGNRGIEKTFHFVHTQVLVETKVEYLKKEEERLISLIQNVTSQIYL